MESKERTPSFAMNIPKDYNIACGPVIIEDGKLLLNKEVKEYGITQWLFPGGKIEETDNSLEDTCIREAKEELGIDVVLTKPLKTVEVNHRGKDWKLYHFLATRAGEIKPGKNIAEWGWHDIHNLPPDCAPNVYEVIDDYLKNEKVQSL